MYPHYTYLYKYKKADLEKLINQECSTQNDHQKWKNNSCYIDSLLFVISKIQATDNKSFTTLKKTSSSQRKIIENIQKHLAEGNVKALRSQLQKFKGSLGPIDWLHEQQEPMDLWRTLEEMFIMYTTKMQIDLYDGDTNTLVDQKSIISDSAIQEVILQKKSSKQSIKIGLKSTSITEHEKPNLWQNKYKKRKEVTTITHANLLIFHINRRQDYTSSNKVYTRVDAPMRIRPKDQSTPLYLRAIIVHHGSSGESGHYTTVFDCKGVWWEYDDMKSNIKKIGLVLPKYILENSSDFFYW
jgi:hypothetical protein